jgi:hypothetical protein
MPTGDVHSPAHRTSPAERLLKLADKRFPELTAAEISMLLAAATGEVAKVGAAMSPQQQGEGDNIRWHPASTWSVDIKAERDRWTIRAALLSWLCTNPKAIKLVHPNGLLIEGAVISGDCFLLRDYPGAGTDFPRPLVFTACDIMGTIWASHAHIASVTLQGCTVMDLYANNVILDKSLSLNHGTCMAGELELRNATIGGNLDCTGGRFENPGRDALIADQVRVKGDVSLSDGFYSTGDVRFARATIGGNLTCTGGRFENPNRDALTADRLRVRGSVFLNSTVDANGNVQHPFHATGTVRLFGATIGGDLTCTGGRFENPDRKALAADGIQVLGNIFLNNGFHATGEVTLPGATIDSDLVCDGGRFENPNGIALTAHRARIAGNLFNRDGFQTHGEVDFALARLGDTIY